MFTDEDLNKSPRLAELSRRRLIGLMCAGPALSIPPAAPQASLAAADHCNTPGAHESFQTGWNSTASNTEGVRAAIEFANPALCGSDTFAGSSSVVWVMAQAQSTEYPEIEMYAQVGYGQFAYTDSTLPNNPNAIGIATFTQWTYRCKAHKECGNGNKEETRYDTTNPPGKLTYRVAKYASDGHIHMTAGGGDPYISQETNYNPSGDWSNSWKGVFYAQTDDTATDTVGTPSDHVSFTEIQRYDGSNWYNYTGSNLLNSKEGSCRYHASDLNGNDSDGRSFSVWTTSTC